MGGGAEEREIIWKKRASVLERERELERQKLEEERNAVGYAVWRLREGFQERKDRAEDTLKGTSAAGAKAAQPEVIWKRREEEEEKDRDRARLGDRGPKIIWRRRERD